MRLAAPANGLTVELLPFGLREPFFPPPLRRARQMKNRREHTCAKNVLSLWNLTGGANAVAWRFGYSVGRRIIHTMLKKKCEIAEKIR
jgi:hypothetical protein